MSERTTHHPSHLSHLKSPIAHLPSPISLRQFAGLALLATTVFPGCTHDLDLVQDPSRAIAVTTTGPWASMIYLARTDSGLIAIDLGWTGAEEALPLAAQSLGGTADRVRYVFLTHAHRDHIAGWPLVRHATFVLGAAEVPFFTGDSAYRGWVTRLSDDLNDYPTPRQGELKLLPVAGDTVIALGRDTMHVFAVPGHTAGSVAYVFRGVLFGGDAINWRPGQGFQGTRPEFSDSTAQSAASMRRLWERLPAGLARVACSAHGKCAPVDSALIASTSR